MTTVQGLDDLLAAGRITPADADACRVFALHPRVTSATISVGEAGGALVEYVDAVDGERRGVRGFSATEAVRYLTLALRRRELQADCHCGGRGWTPEVDADGYSTGRERYCDCPAGQRRETEER